MALSGGTELLRLRGRSVARHERGRDHDRAVGTARRRPRRRCRTISVPGSSSTAGPRTSAIRADPTTGTWHPALAAEVDVARALDVDLGSRRELEALPARCTGTLARARQPTISRRSGSRTANTSSCTAWKSSQQPLEIARRPEAVRAQRHLELPHLARDSAPRRRSSMTPRRARMPARSSSCSMQRASDRRQRVVHPLALEIASTSCIARRPPRRRSPTAARRWRSARRWSGNDELPTAQPAAIATMLNPAAPPPETSTAVAGIDALLDGDLLDGVDHLLGRRRG